MAPGLRLLVGRTLWALIPVLRQIPALTVRSLGLRGRNRALVQAGSGGQPDCTYHIPKAARPSRKDGDIPKASSG